MKIFLTGIMGSGKSTVGEVLAQQLGWTFIDTDTSIEVNSGKSISEIFHDDGEAQFRSLEKETVLKLLEVDHAIIALGGGVLEDSEIRKQVKESGELVWLQIDPEIAANRLSGDNTRPLLSDAKERNSKKTELRKILQSRAANYATADVTITADNLSPESVADIIIQKFDLKPKLVSQSIAATDEFGYDVIVEQGALTSLGKYLTNYDFSSTVAVITDSNVSRLYRQQVEKSLSDAGFDVASKVLLPGESTKNLESLEALYTHFSQVKLDRKSPVIALGGGVIGDLAGYFAASYLRGIPLVHVPTTLLAQVDSSIGGKVGINLPAGKNLVGAFYKPTLVFTDVNALYTLPKREWQTGLGEVLKYGFIGNPEIFDLLDENKHFPEIVKTCIRQKLEIVRQDFKEAGIRQILNFGHTLGHALEQITNYTLVTHGEAVYWGMIGALSISHQSGKLGASALKESLEILGRVAIQLPEININTNAILQALQSDKKRLDGTIHWILLEDIGKPVISTAVNKDQIIEAIEFIQEFIRN